MRNASKKIQNNKNGRENGTTEKRTGKLRPFRLAFCKLVDIALLQLFRCMAFVGVMQACKTLKLVYKQFAVILLQNNKWIEVLLYPFKQL